MPSSIGKQIKEEMVRATAGLIAQQDAQRRTTQELIPRAREIVQQQIRQGLAVDPCASFDMAEFIRRMEAY